MANIINSLDNMRLLENLSRKKTAIHQLHPLVKLLTTVGYITVVVSFGRSEISGLLPFFLYPLLVFILAELPVKPLLMRLLLVEPFIIGIGILNPLFDRQIYWLGGIAISRGWITFSSLFIKCGLTVTAALLLIATTGMDGLAKALRMLKLPRLFVLQLLLTYRYIAVLMEEVILILRAYHLRAPRQKGIHRSAWGSLAGQLILRTYDRAQRVYEAMCLRGFTGDYYVKEDKGIRYRDLLYLAGWAVFFTVARIFNISILLGSWLTGVIK
ncbi:MAG TPA: cobalt ECF transporter T component CbiQ [Desulfitobacteriaceae bacterium]|nr:cobalt ECF transporter T component CbiQ [Desulfitobacteriaceae bacterium]